MMKLPLKPAKKSPVHRDKLLVWTGSAPFVENSRGVLIHRPCSVTTVSIHREPHIAIKYWCGNGVAGKRNLTFLDEPPVGKFLCVHCEANAIKAGLPSADAISGRHVQTGLVKAVPAPLDEYFRPASCPARVDAAKGWSTWPCR